MAPASWSWGALRGLISIRRCAATAGTRHGPENRSTQEWHFFFQNTLRWRNLRKVTVAQVQGTVYAAGLTLMWAST